MNDITSDREWNATYDRLTRASHKFQALSSSRRILSSPLNHKPIGTLIEAHRIREGSHGDSMHKLILVQKGHLDIEGCAGGWIVLPGHMILIPAHREFNVTISRETHLHVLHLDPSMTPWRHHGCWVTRATHLAREMIAQAVTMSMTMQNPKHNGAHADQANHEDVNHEDMNQEKEKKFDLYMAAFSALCPDWFTNSRILFLPSAQDDDTARLIDYLRTHIATSHVEDAAKHLGLPQRSLHRLCVTHFGLNLRALIREIRIIFAMELLATTDQSIGTIAQTIGFSSLSAFTSAFTNRLGTTPRQFALENRQFADQSPPRYAA